MSATDWWDNQSLQWHELEEKYIYKGEITPAEKGWKNRLALLLLGVSLLIVKANKGVVGDG